MPNRYNRSAVLDNLLSVNVTGGSQACNHTYVYDATTRRLSQVTNTVGGAVVANLTWDVQGNLAGKGPSGSVQSYTFDLGNRLRSVPGKEIGYQYDGHGRRVYGQTVGSSHILSQYANSGQLLYQENHKLSRRTDYVYLGNRLVAYRERPLSTTTVTLKYQHTDALGSPIAVTNTAMTVIETSEYEPYGQLVNRALFDGPGYTGHVQDAATGLTYMQQRYYDPQLGVFLSADPVTAYVSPIGHFHRYRYAANNPYKYIDPDGREFVIPWGQLGEIAARRGVQAGVASQLDSPAPGPGDVVAVVILVGGAFEIGHQIWQANQAGTDAPPLPGELVGEDPIPRRSGNSATSGTLRPKFGGTGNFDSDLRTLAGKTRPSGPGDKAPPGSQIGENGVFGRENSSGGQSIDIPANGDKPHEVLHYPPKK